MFRPGLLQQHSGLRRQSGNRKREGGRYGNGQLILLRYQALLLVASEEGGLALVKASLDGFAELARADR